MIIHIDSKKLAELLIEVTTNQMKTDSHPRAIANNITQAIIGEAMQDCERCGEPTPTVDTDLDGRCSTCAMEHERDELDASKETALDIARENRESRSRR